MYLSRYSPYQAFSCFLVRLELEEDLCRAFQMLSVINQGCSASIACQSSNSIDGGLVIVGLPMVCPCSLINGDSKSFMVGIGATSGGGQSLR